MKKRFWIHDLGSVSFYLGMNIEPNREHHTIDIHQHSYIRMILVKFRTDKSRPVTTPMVMKLHRRKQNEESCDPTIYQSVIGSVMYPMTATRHDIAYAIGVLSRCNHDPSNEHMVALKRMFGYLNSTKNWRLRFGGAFGAAVDWRSRNQKSTAQSTTDAEYYAFGVGCMWLTQISHLLNELGIPTIPHVFSDWQSLIASIENRINRGTAVAHIVTKYYHAADMARDREIDLSYVPTAEMLANCFTKPLPKPAFLKQFAAIGMIVIGLGNGLGIGIGNGLGNGLRTIGNGLGNGHRNGIGSGKGIGNAVGMKLIDWECLFRGDPCYLIGSSSLLFTVLFETDVIAVLEECWADW